MKVIPEITTDEIIFAPSTVLLLSGVDTWDDQRHIPIVEKATELLECGATFDERGAMLAI
ncbi:hypothetical protein [Oceanobacillus chungangensis]|uniref:hypothetical protein n=1 Tax=Oceanobacillus chungangensis TaxID=1229152 RepID=UPI001B871DEC|nr:hypothetical protein [Oceanobacillus chungangensis]